MNSRKIAYCALLSAVALLLSYVERLLAIPMIIPGMKLGLANVAVLIALYLFDSKTAFGISLLRILLSGFLFTGFASFLYSAAGAILSFAAMRAFQKTKRFSMVYVSIIGGINHNIGQMVIACLVVENIKLLYYLPILLVLGAVTGFLTGIVGVKTIYYLKH